MTKLLPWHIRKKPTSKHTFTKIYQEKKNYLLKFIVFRILAARICELNSAMPSPSSKLLEGYTGSNVDDSKFFLNLIFQDGIKLLLIYFCVVEEEFVRKTLEDSLKEREEDLYRRKTSQAESSSSCSENPTPTKTQLPQNLEDLVQKALLNLRDSEVEVL